MIESFGETAFQLAHGKDGLAGYVRFTAEVAGAEVIRIDMPLQIAHKLGEGLLDSAAAARAECKRTGTPLPDYPVVESRRVKREGQS